MSLNLSSFGDVCFQGHLKKQLRLGVTIATMLLGLGGCASHNEHATAAAAVVDFSGNWRVIFPEQNASITGFAFLKQNGTNVTGWVGPSPDDPIPITGVVNGSQLVFKTFPQPGRTVAFDRCKLTLSANRMTGTMEGGDAGKGTIEFIKTTR